MSSIASKVKAANTLWSWNIVPLLDPADAPSKAVTMLTRSRQRTIS